MARRLWLCYAFCATLLIASPAHIGFAAEPKEKARQVEPWMVSGSLAALRDPDNRVRALAIEALATLGKAEYSEEIAKFLQPNYPAYLRATALEAYAELHVADQSHLKEIAGFLEEDNSDLASSAVQAIAAAGAAKQYRPRILPVITTLSKSQFETDQLSNVLQALATAGVAEDYRQEILKLFRREDGRPNATGATAAAAAGLLREFRPQVLTLFDVGKDPDGSLRREAIRAVSSAGLLKEYRPQVLALFDASKDPDGSRRKAALDAVSSAGLLKEYRPQVLALFDASAGSLRREAIQAVSSAGLLKEYRPQVLALFDARKDPVGSLRKAALDAVSSAGLLKEYRPQVLALFDAGKDPDGSLRKAAINALSSAGLLIGYEPQILAIFGSGDSDTAISLRMAALEALSSPALLERYRQQVLASCAAHENEVRVAAVRAIAKAGLTQKYRNEIANVLAARDIPPELRLYAAAAVVASDGSAEHRSVVRRLFGVLLADEAQLVPSQFIFEFRNLGITREFLPQLMGSLDLVLDRYRGGRGSERLLSAMIPDAADLRAEELVAVLSPIYDDSSLVRPCRFLVHYHGGGRPEPELLLKVLARRERDLRKLLPEDDERIKAFRLLLRVFVTQGLRQELRTDIATTLADLAELIHWSPSNMKYLVAAHNLLAEFRAQSVLIGDEISRIERAQRLRQWLVRSGGTILAHLSFWMALIFLYPRSGMVQAIFFWNPWIRKILGFGYVGFALTWVPFLRRRLLAPFRESLLSEAGLHGFTVTTYYSGSLVLDKATGKKGLITEALRLTGHGQWVLEGESGLGKSMFLRYIASISQRTVVYLPAERCASGVLEAIQAKLIGKANDSAYLRNLIWSGAMDIYIDGLNEVTADNRARISDFAEKYFRGNILMTTQPMEWSPPSTARVYVLEPLELSQILDFLKGRESLLPKGASVQGQAYRTSCEKFLNEVLHSGQAEELAKGMAWILSNPMDLTVIADMLARGETPDLVRLQEQQYDLMAADFSRVHTGKPFPISAFSEAVYQMRLEDKRELAPEPFGEALETMERFKMVVRREQAEGKVWLFRHDKVMDFFLVQAFLGTSNQRPDEHLADPRFRGVYLMLATFLPYEQAMVLREKLLQDAADRKDHSVSDTFIQLLRPREATRDAASVGTRDRGRLKARLPNSHTAQAGTT